MTNLCVFFHMELKAILNAREPYYYACGALGKPAAGLNRVNLGIIMNRPDFRKQLLCLLLVYLVRTANSLLLPVSLFLSADNLDRRGTEIQSVWRSELGNVL